MAVSKDDGPMPLYMHTVKRILKEMRMVQQATGETFCYSRFKDLIMDCELSPAQLGPLNQRLDTLESFMPNDQTIFGSTAARKGKGKGNGQRVEQVGNDWSSQVSRQLHPRQFLTLPAWMPYNCRSFMPLCHARGCLLLVQHMSEYLP